MFTVIQDIPGWFIERMSFTSPSFWICDSSGSVTSSATSSAEAPG